MLPNSHLIRTAASTSARSDVSVLVSVDRSHCCVTTVQLREKEQITLPFSNMQLKLQLQPPFSP